MKKKLNVFFASGKDFIKYFNVAVISLLETNKDLDLTIFLIYDFKDTIELDKVVFFLKEKYHVELNLIFQDSSIFDKYKVSPHVAKNTYLRLLLAEIIPGHIDTGLYLDSDIIITGSLAELTELEFFDLDNYTVPEYKKYLYAAPEIKYQSDKNSARITSLGISIDAYFNAGVMMINLKNWRLKNTSNKLIQLAEKYMDVVIHSDQDILNIYFANRWGKLDTKFNAVHLIWKRPKPPLIIHFAGPSKPWYYFNNHPYKSFYLKYQKKIPLKHQKYVDFSYNKVPLKCYRVIRHFLNYFRELYLGRLYD